ncbi:tetratricopeptide repeat protein [Hymenobacter jeollabukensis]|uniref:DUF3808 domain-containing protein n=1 Tax=Hymenobacter jeollabukensis TaxID=2025313 RepID=A0A5R8WPL3_9BACT|nr:DUF3808 domain-containing protein [Hymenobacter jeollabukensis]TLM91810.1 DUF3808 domain-containing protein [Hymenobacter jeollabukensis]
MKVLAEVRRGLRAGALRAALLLLPLCVCAAQEPDSNNEQRTTNNETASDQLSPAARRAYTELLKLRTGTAQALARTELRQQPGSPGALLVAEGAGFAELVISQDASRYQTIIDQQDAALAALDAQPRTALRDYVRGEIRLHQAVAQVMFGHELQGAWSLRQAYLQVQQNARRWPGYLPTVKTLGLCEFLIGSVPEGYRWFLNLLGLPGNTEAGLQHLRTAAQRPHDFQPEAQILVALIRQTYYGADEEAAALVARLSREQPDNLLFSYLGMSVQKKLHHADQALAYYRNQPTGPTYVPVAYLHHMAADLLLYQGQYTASERANQQFLSEYRGVHYRKDAWFKLYLAYWLSGDAAQAERSRQQISKGGDTTVEEDRYAQRFVDDRVPLSRPLTRARLQIDGGYYRPALATLDEFRATGATPLRDRLEEPYRRARAYHGLQRLDSARLYYGRCITASGTAPYYFAPQSALQLGYICQEAGQKAQAKAYFQQALSYGKHEYKTSTDAKAKVALASLK